MPFTASHAAAVLPGLRAARGKGALVAAGLVAGAMAPDVPFFAESLVRGAYRHGGVTHRWWAAPTVDVVVGAGLVAGWYGLWREPLREAVPGRWNAVVPAGRPSAGELGWAAGAVAAGAATHLVWDSFTHHGRAGVRALPALEREVGGVPLYTALQYGTSLAGLAVLARYAGPWREGRRGTAAVLGAAALAGAVERVRRRERGFVDEACFGAGAGLAVGAALLRVLFGRPGAARTHRWAPAVSSSDSPFPEPLAGLGSSSDSPFPEPLAGRSARGSRWWRGGRRWRGRRRGPRG